MADGGTDPPFLTKREVAAKMRVSVRTIERYVANGYLPQHETPGGHCRYLPADVERLMTKPPTWGDPRFSSEWLPPPDFSAAYGEKRWREAQEWAREALAKPPRKRRQTPKA